MAGMIITKEIGQPGQQKSIPVTCKCCGKRLKKPQAAKHEICPRCQRDRRY